MSGLWWGIILVLAIAGALLRLELLLMLCTFLALVGGASWLWQRTCFNGFTYHRRFGATRLFCGEETDLHIEFVNAKPLPLAWLRAEDEIPAALELPTVGAAFGARIGRRLLVNVLSLRWYERVTRHYRLRAVQRGAWRVGPVDLSSGDIFGFSVRRCQLPETVTILVFPRIVPLTALGLPALRPFGEQKTPRRLVEDPLRLMGTRTYTTGDSFRHIHWKATARRRELQTKVFEPSAARPVAIFLNINTYERILEGMDVALREYAISTAASIGRWARDDSHPTGIFVNAVVQPGGMRIRLRPSSHPDQLGRILEALARVVSYGRWPIEAIVQMEAPHLPYGTTLIVISAVVNQRLRRTLVDLQRRGYGVALVSLGETEPDALPPMIRHYHVGGREEWDALESLELA